MMLPQFNNVNKWCFEVIKHFLQDSHTFEFDNLFNSQKEILKIQIWLFYVPQLANS